MERHLYRISLRQGHFSDQLRQLEDIGVDVDVDVSQLLVAAQNVTSLLSKIRSLVTTEGSTLRPLVLTTPDRSDVLLSLGCLHASKVGPPDWPGVAGVLLCDYDGQRTAPRHCSGTLVSFLFNSYY